MNKEEIENYITELESMFELSELEEHSRNILKVGIYIKQLQQENQSLKKQLEEYKEQVNKGLYNTCLPYTTGYNKAIKDKEIQQKDFIEWLTNEININPYDISDYIYENIINTILSKYKESGE